VPLTRLQQLCRDWAQKNWGDAPGNDSHRYVLQDHDSTSMYRMLLSTSGLRQRSSAEENLDTWFRQTHPSPPSPELTPSCLYYQPHIEGISERFVLIFATPEQKKMAWKYGHKRQMLLDGTFGICSARALLFILMAIDDRNKGIPVAFFLFTARDKAKATHADYDGKLLGELLGHYKTAMGKNELGEELDIQVANTDNDARERKGLEKNWPDILLVLCLFHTWQAWRNGLNKHLRVIPKGEQRQDVRKHLAKFLMRLLKEITTYPDAISAYNTQLHYFKNLGKERNPMSKKKAEGGLAFLTYLKGYLNVQSHWFAWSKAGVLEAAKRLKMPVEKVARTNNHLESFNGRIKRKYYTAYLHSGRLPRIDVWVLIMITKVMPAFFQERAERRSRTDYYECMRHALPSTDQPGSPNHSDPEISVLVDAEFSVALEMDMIAEMVDDDENEEGNGSDVDEMKEVDGYGEELQVDEDGNASHSIPADTDSQCGSELDWLGDHALDESSILADLLDDKSCAFPFTLAQPGPPVNLEPAAPAIIPSEPAAAASYSNAEATSIQEILAAEDIIVHALRDLKLLSVNPAILAFYTSPSIQERLGIHGAPMPLTTNSVFNTASNLNAPQPKISTSASILFDQHADSLLPMVKRTLHAFEPQAKQQRKPSYGIR
jgi:hypothetical protein